MKKKLINFFIAIKIASLYKKEFIYIAFNKQFWHILNFLYKEGFILSFKIEKNLFRYKIFLRFFLSTTPLCDIKILSTSSKKKFFKYTDLCCLNEKQLSLIVSTSKGLLSISDCKRLRVGGKILIQL